MRPEVRMTMRVFVGTLASVAVTAALFATVGCSSARSITGTPPTVPDNPAIVLDEHANSSTVQVVVGRRVELLLHSSYWTDFGSSQSAVVRADGSVRTLPTSQRCIPGGGCNPVLATFTAQKVGTAVLSASRTSCGEALRCSPANSHYRVTIVVTR
jgi:hypothetical protein